MACSKVPLDKSDFKECFANTCTYGNGDDPWPHKAILFYNIRKVDEEDGTWKRVDNIPGKDPKHHAEYLMLGNIQDNPPEENVEYKLIIYLSYSPCKDCAKELVEFKIKKNRIVTIDIRFGTFYKVYKGDRNGNRQGLVNLVKYGFNLDVFSCDAHWHTFLNDINISPDEHDDYLACITDERNARQEEDQNMLREIKAKAEEDLSIEKAMNKLSI